MTNLVPASQQDDTRHFHKGDEFVEKYGLTHVHRSDGICHQLMTEAGYVKPGDIAFGTDSHTTTYGCVGAFSSGIGYTEMASILGTGTMWIKVPETIKVVIDGELPENVMSKDIIRLIGDLPCGRSNLQSTGIREARLRICQPAEGQWQTRQSRQEQNVLFSHQMRRRQNIGLNSTTTRKPCWR